MKKLFTLILICLIFSSTPLISQDVAIVGWNTDSPTSDPSMTDGFAVVALVDIPSTQNIFFTDMPYDPATNTFTDIGTDGDGIMQITWSGTWNKGTIISAVETGTTTDMFTITTSVNGPASPGITINNPKFSIGGNEGMNIFTSNTLVNPNLNIVEIYAFHSANSLDPNPGDDPDCPCSADFVEVEFGDGTIDAGNFTPGLRSGAVSLTTYNSTGSYTTSGSNVVFDLTEFTNLTFGGSGVLPIELGSFKVDNMESEVKVDWVTISETNNEYFSIEHSDDGERFESIGTVEGAGNSFVPLQYSFIHKNPATGLNYYRLKQIDFDGKFSYSDIEVINYKNLSPLKFEISPNPTSELIQIHWEGKINSVVQFFIFDLNGKLVKHETTTQESEISSFQINVQDLPNGSYFLKAESLLKVEYQKFIKQ